MVYEPGGARLDRYGRTLAYLYLEPGGLFVNREIIARGYGHAYTRYPFAFVDDFRAAERAAREGQLGLWGLGDAADEPPSETTVFVTPSGTRYHRAQCRYLSDAATSVALPEAAARHRPCSICNPPDPSGAAAKSIKSATKGSL
jgi:hypothetical protein